MLSFQSNSFDFIVDGGEAHVTAEPRSVPETSFRAFLPPSPSSSTVSKAYGDSAFWSFFIFLLPKLPLLVPKSLSFLFPSSFTFNALGENSPMPPPPPPSSPTLKLFGRERRADGSRALDRGRDGNAGGMSFGLSDSSLRRSESSISSNELLAIFVVVVAEFSNFHKFFFFSRIRISLSHKLKFNTNPCIRRRKKP